ncbi:MAG: LEA type 2 family protein [Opitutus sp.]
MTKSRPGFLLVAFVAFLIAGCAGNAFHGGLSVSLVDFRPTEASLLESRGTLTLRYTNDTIAPLGYSGSSHKLFLNGSYVGKAVSNQPFGIPPLNTVTQDVSVQFENLALIRQLVAVHQSQSVAYRLESVIFQTLDEDKFEIKLRSEGSLDLKALTGEPK